jgi:hypothetical protein
MPDTEELVDTYEFRPYVPKGFGGLPTTAKNALQRARALLKDEARWVKGNWYTIEDPDEDPENPYCDDWKVCLDGALLAVTVGSKRQLTRVNSRYEEDDSMYGGHYVEYAEDLSGFEREWSIEPDDLRDKPMWPIIKEARKLIVQAATELYPRPSFYSEYDDVPGFNDATGTEYPNVMAVLNKAIKLA